MASLQAAVLAHGADAGIAHDGDADRCLAVDAAGQLVDGDQILAICALALRERGALAARHRRRHGDEQPRFRHAMDDAGIKVIETAVGDRYVLEAMRAGGYTLGGEQSGHVVFAEHATTGDGLLTALVLLARMAATGSLACRAGRRDEAAAAGAGSTCAPTGRCATAPAVLAASISAAELGDGRPRAAAAVGHRAVGPGDGRGRHRGAGALGRAERIAAVVSAG